MKRIISVFFVCLLVLLAGIGLYVTASAAPEQAEKSDIAGHWAEKEMKELIDQGMMKGYRGKYRPDDPITRAEFITLLVRSLKYKIAEASIPIFPDVSESTPWAVPYVNTAYDHHLIDSTGEFRPKSNILRSEIAEIIARVLQERGEGEVTINGPSFGDVPANVQYFKAVETVSRKGIMQGDKRKFRPDDTATRAEAAVIILRLQKLNETEAKASN